MELRLEGVAEFERELDDFAEALGADAELLLRRSALRIFADVTEPHPVDTGYARANWRLDAGQLVEALVVPDPSAAQGSGWAAGVNAAQVSAFNGMAVQLGKDIFLSNSTPYIVPLELGSSAQAPQGMLAVAVENERVRIEAEAAQL
jgi:hypothetical protein